MDYNKIKAEIDCLYTELYEKYMMMLKDYVNTHGVKRNMFINTLSVDVSMWGICHHSANATIDYIEYDTDFDEMRYVILNEDGTAFRIKTIGVGDTELLRVLFRIWTKF